jgi:hypothetical protein
MFGTDHPFFPPLEEEEHDSEWLSVTSIMAAIMNVSGDDELMGVDILGGNALHTLGIEDIHRN